MKKKHAQDLLYKNTNFQNMCVCFIFFNYLRFDIDFKFKIAFEN